MLSLMQAHSQSLWHMMMIVAWDWLRFVQSLTEVISGMWLKVYSCSTPEATGKLASHMAGDSIPHTLSKQAGS